MSLNIILGGISDLLLLIAVVLNQKQKKLAEQFSTDETEKIRKNVTRNGLVLLLGIVTALLVAFYPVPHTTTNDLVVKILAVACLAISCYLLFARWSELKKLKTMAENDKQIEVA